jgi:hypothetical protein
MEFQTAWINNVASCEGKKKYICEKPSTIPGCEYKEDTLAEVQGKCLVVNKVIVVKDPMVKIGLYMCLLFIIPALLTYYGVEPERLSNILPKEN